VGPRAGLDRCGKSGPPTGFRSPDRPARSQSLYRLRYPAHSFTEDNIFLFLQAADRVLKSKEYLCRTANIPISSTDAGVGPFPHLGKNYLRKFTREIRLIIDMFSEKHVSLYKTNKENIKHSKSATGLESSLFFWP